MALNIAQGNMYGFVTHTWNTIKGRCPHGCSYCYMKRVPSGQDCIWYDESKFTDNHGKGKVIFVGSSNDLFASGIQNRWIERTIKHCSRFDNRYFFQSKNPKRFQEFDFPEQKNLFSELHPTERKYRFCTTVETNRIYKEIMGNTPTPVERMEAMPKGEFLTIEPIMDFDLPELLDIIKISMPEQVNIGADSGNNGLPEPSKVKVKQLIEGLETFTKVNRKDNLNRILNTS